MKDKLLMAELAVEMRKLGWTATLRAHPSGDALLDLVEAPVLRSPVVIAGRFVWGRYSAKKPSTMAKRLDDFLCHRGAYAKK